MRFIHETLPQRVVFASGAAPAAVAAEVAALRATKVMLVAAPAEAALADRVGADLPVAVRHDEVVMHVPVDIAERARKAATEGAVDALVCVGGGSTTGLAKAVALTTGLPIVAVHCVDSMWGPRADPIDRALAAEGIRGLAQGLPAVAADPTGPTGREQTLYGAYLAAFASPGPGHAPQDLPGAGRHVQPPACPDPRGGAAARPPVPD